MWYRSSITIPASTSNVAPVTVETEVSQGTISLFYRLFPKGCAGQVRLQVFYQTRQVLPATPGQSYLGDGSEVLGDSSIVLDEPPYILSLRGWSPGTTYDHTIHVEFYIEKTQVLMPVPLESRAFPVGL